MTTDGSKSRISQAKTILAYVAAWVLLGYAGFQFFGWTGAILLPIGVTFGMALLFAPFAVVLVGSGLVIQAIKGVRAVKRRISGGAE